jgi:hypothetical protein
MKPEPVALDQKRARLDPGDGTDSGTGTDVAMETTTVDSSEAATVAALSPRTSLKSTASDRGIVTRLRPFVLDVDEVQADWASLCSSLEKLDFLQLSGNISSAPKDDILEQLNDVYFDAVDREAKT